MAQDLFDWTTWFWPRAFGAPGEPPRTESVWATPNEIVLETEGFRLRGFGAGDQAGAPLLIVAPYAIHGAGIVDFADGHSLVQALIGAGLGRVHVLERRSAGPAMRFQTIDDNLAGLNVVVDELGGRAQLVGVCQGGWLSLAYAARFPRKVERLVLAGAPVDLDAAPSSIVQATRACSPDALEAMVAASGGVIQGSRMLASLEAAQLQENDVAGILQDPHTKLGEAFAGWNAITLDLPGRYWLQSAEWLFRENRLARDQFVALGRTIRLRDATCPLFVLAGRDDPIAPPAQALAAADLVGAPAEQVEVAVAPCGHLSLFMGAKTLRREWRTIAAFLARRGSSRAPRPRAGGRSRKAPA